MMAICSMGDWLVCFDVRLLGAEVSERIRIEGMVWDTKVLSIRVSCPMLELLKFLSLLCLSPSSMKWTIGCHMDSAHELERATSLKTKKSIRGLHCSLYSTGLSATSLTPGSLCMFVVLQAQVLPPCSSCSIKAHI